MKKLAYLVATLLIASSLISQNIPIDFEPGGIGAGFTWTVFENGTNPPVEFVSNPDVNCTNTSATVAKFTALQAGAPFAGCQTMHGSDIGSFTLDSSNALIRIMVYKSVISQVGIKLVTFNNSALPEIKLSNTLINEWEELTFDFSIYIGFGFTYDQIVIFPDFQARPSDNIIYFDNVYDSTAAIIYPNNIAGCTNPAYCEYNPDASCDDGSCFIVGNSNLQTFFTASPPTIGLGNNGYIQLFTLGGSGNFTYTWSPNVSDNNFAANLTYGTYSITIQDNSNCGSVVQSITLQNPNCPSILLFNNSNPSTKILEQADDIIYSSETLTTYKIYKAGYYSIVEFIELQQGFSTNTGSNNFEAVIEDCNAND